MHSSLFVGYMCDHVLPVLSKVVTHEPPAPAEGAAPAPVADVQLELLKLFAEMSQYCGLGLGEQQTERLDKLYAKLLVRPRLVFFLVFFLKGLTRLKVA